MDASTIMGFGFMAAIVVVISFGWRQLVRGPSTKIFFGGYLVLLSITLSLTLGALLLPVLMVLVLYFIVDLLFIAPRQGNHSVDAESSARSHDDE